ncbi:lipid II:glycine glycyltransferase FemX [Intrasporangium calvum]|uniref:Methicillin resistance protein n=1 Tax=Intrasporangium calvum (strain ATCC 23552 / DSM 43043 / JCM 3097 / NBRC 12989 / NCIMB 10167 / NRRL B-3866 / 7 KIP) TaxID=710696 RepID=E6S888_INTC7|nr:peptidoglycan bridge formation glycyltransferase FemA/FemB family protein [Intrasporangium calvum]ADU48009.1 Methicillin resistance protein [Intrasporangium calvum DSM 43043]
MDEARTATSNPGTPSGLPEPTEPADASRPAGPFTVRAITADEARATVLELAGSFLQTPAWARTKPDWTTVHLGWFDATGARVGAGLVLSRSLPRVRRSFAYLPEGPALPWTAVAEDPGAWLDPLVAWARTSGAFALRLGFPVVSRSWQPDVVKKQISEGGLMSFTTLPPAVDNPVARRVETWLDRTGWRPIGWGSTAAVGQPRYLCVIDLEGRDTQAALRSMNQQWRRNIKKADKAGVHVRSVGVEGVERFHQLYVETAERDHFVPRAKSYFEQMVRAFSDGGDEVTGRIYEAHVDGDVLASALMVRVGDTFSYLYGGSTSRNRDARASNALQWQAIQDAIDLGCTSYDLRGFNTSLGATSPLIGLLLFKLGAGADVVEMVGERELVLSRFWHTAFEKAMALRVAINNRRAGSEATPDTDV